MRLWEALYRSCVADPQERPCCLGIEGSQHAALSSVLYRSNEEGWDMDRGA